MTESAATDSAVARKNAQAAKTRGRYLDFDERWAAMVAGTVDLEQGLALLDGTSPEPFDINAKEVLDTFADEIGGQLSGDRAIDGGLKAMRDILHGRHGLTGNSENYYLPRNSYLAGVLDTRVGIPISLCAVAILVGRRLELPVHGIGAPGHFLGFYGDPDLPVGSFFDAFDGFRRITSGEVKVLVESHAGTVDASMLRPASDRIILARFLSNLTNAYGQAGDIEHVRNIERWHTMLSR